MSRDTGMVPRALLSKPTLDVVETWYWDEFNNLSFDRATDRGMPKPISTEQIETYCRVFHIPDVDDFHRWMRMIDSIYLTEYYKRKAAENAKT